MKVPPEWSLICADGACESITVGIVIQPASFYSSDQNGIRAFRSGNVGEGKVIDRDWVFLSVEGNAKHKKSVLRSGDVVIVRTGAPGVACVVTDKFSGSNCIDMLIAKPTRSKLLSEFFCQFLNSEFGRRQALGKQGGLAQKHLNVGALKTVSIPLPTLPEQKKIAAILGACDEAIEAQERLIAQKQQRKKGLMQKLLTGKTRFPQFAGKPWKSVKASELFMTRSEKNKNDAPVLSVTQDQGILLRSELERRISGDSENYPNYKLVHPGDFVISLRSFQGGLEYSRIKGAVSPAYHVIYKKREICDEFYRYFFKSWEFIGRLTIATIGIRDGKQIAFKDFSFMKLPEPALEEQRAISRLLCTLDEDVALHQTKLEQLKQQKKGLMQQLLTGKVRVAV